MSYVPFLLPDFASILAFLLGKENVPVTPCRVHFLIYLLNGFSIAVFTAPFTEDDPCITPNGAWFYKLNGRVFSDFGGFALSTSAASAFVRLQEDARFSLFREIFSHYAFLPDNELRVAVLKTFPNRLRKAKTYSLYLSKQALGRLFISQVKNPARSYKRISRLDDHIGSSKLGQYSAQQKGAELQSGKGWGPLPRLVLRREGKAFLPFLSVFFVLYIILKLILIEDRQGRIEFIVGFFEKAFQGLVQVLRHLA